MDKEKVIDELWESALAATQAQSSGGDQCGWIDQHDNLYPLEMWKGEGNPWANDCLANWKPVYRRPPAPSTPVPEATPVAPGALESFRAWQADAPVTAREKLDAMLKDRPRPTLEAADFGAPMFAEDYPALAVERMLSDCVPGGSVCDPQQVADAIREWFAIPRWPQAAEPVAVVCDGYELRWAGAGPIAPLIKRNGIKVGDKLYAAPQAPAAQPLTEDAILRAWDSLNALACVAEEYHGEWVKEHIAAVSLVLRTIGIAPLRRAGHD